MRQKKKTSTLQMTSTNDGLSAWRIGLWLVILGGMLFFWPTCLDRYLAPRFFFLSAALLVAFILVWKDLKATGDWRLQVFDWMLLGWYGLNLASVYWSYSWSEGIFYAQKTLLLFLVYWFVRQALRRDETMLRQTFRQIISLVTWAVCGILVVQVALAFSQHGLNYMIMHRGFLATKVLQLIFCFSC